MASSHESYVNNDDEPMPAFPADIPHHYVNELLPPKEAVKKLMRHGRGGVVVLFQVRTAKLPQMRAAIATSLSRMRKRVQQEAQRRFREHGAVIKVPQFTMLTHGVYLSEHEGVAYLGLKLQQGNRGSYDTFTPEEIAQLEQAMKEGQ